MWNWLKTLLGIGRRPHPYESIAEDMKYLIVGLGNIGQEYDDTRHNIGFEVVDSLAIQLGGKWKVDKLGSICEVKHKGRFITLLKPSTFMNRSGKAIQFWLTKLKIKKENLLVVVDDIHMDFGKHRLRLKGSDAGHNGLKDIQQTIGGNVYPRLKVGIGNDFHPGQQVKYVLGKWTRKELESLQDVIIKAAEMSKSFVSIGAQRTMNQYND